MCDAAFVLRGSLFFGEDPLVVGRPGHAGSAGRVQRWRRARYRHTARRAARGCSEAGSSGLVVSPRPPRASATPGRVSGTLVGSVRACRGRARSYPSPARSRDPRLRLGADDPRPLPPPRRRDAGHEGLAGQAGAAPGCRPAGPSFTARPSHWRPSSPGRAWPLATRSASSAALAPNGASATSADSSPRSSRSARIPRSRRISSRTCSITRTCGSSSSRAAPSSRRSSRSSGTSRSSSSSSSGAPRASRRPCGPTTGSSPGTPPSRPPATRTSSPSASGPSTPTTRPSSSIPAAPPGPPRAR
jgi:hypothetical protein